MTETERPTRPERAGLAEAEAVADAVADPAAEADARPTWPRSWPRSKRRSASAAPRATCRPSSSASSTSCSWPTPRWPGGAATSPRPCAWSMPRPSWTRWSRWTPQRAAGAVVKKGMRTLLLWYVGWITHQVSQFASAVSRTLHIVEGRLQELERKVEAQRVPSAGVVEVPGAAPGRRLVGRAGGRGRERRSPAASCTPPAATGGWCGRSSPPAATPTGSTRGPTLVEQGVLTVSDLRGEDLADHLRAVAPAGLGAIVLSGVVDGMSGGERAQLLRLIGTTLAPDGVLVVHSLSRSAWDGGRRAARGRSGSRAGPCGRRPGGTSSSESGYDATVAHGPGGADYLVTAVRATVPPPEPTPPR